MIKVVIDTNVLISGLLWTGTPHQLLKLVDSGRILMCLNQPMLKELSDVLERKKFSSRLNVLQLNPTDLVSSVAEKAFLYETIHMKPVIKRDPDDDLVLACAIAANAKFIVTGDLDLLTLQRFKQIKIIHPNNALKLFQP